MIFRKTIETKNASINQMFKSFFNDYLGDRLHLYRLKLKVKKKDESGLSVNLSFALEGTQGHFLSFRWSNRLCAH